MSDGKSFDDEEPTEQRTDLAEDRTILANERTFAGWMRTSMACNAIGVGFHALFSKVEPAWVPKSIATGFLLLGILVIFTAVRRARSVMARLDTHRVKTAKTMNLRLFAIIISAGAAVFVFAIWFLPIG